MIKREELEEKLAKRKAEAEVKVLVTRSKALETARRQELNIFEEEARRLTDLVDRIYDDSDSDNNSNPDKSLEWDSDECNTSPSFVTINTSEISPVVQEIIEDILNSSTQGGEDESTVPLKPTPGVNRRNTSTDANFLASSPVGNNRPIHFIWPPRFPSQEPEDYSPLNYPPLQPRSQLSPEVEEVFNTEEEEQLAIMDPADYEVKHREIQLAAKKVQRAKMKFVANNVTIIDIHIYDTRLKEIRDKLDTYEDAVEELIFDLDENNADDKLKIDSLEAGRAALQEEIMNNEKEVKEKVKSLKESQPLSKAEEESLELHSTLGRIPYV